MIHNSLRHWMYIGALFIGTSLVATSCVNDDYDLDNLDMTMGLGSDGLSVKLGSTEKILLGDILDVNETVKLDANNLYYLVKSGTTDYSFHVDAVHADFTTTDIPTSYKVLDFQKVLDQLGLAEQVSSVEVPADFNPSGMAEGSTSFKLNIDNIGDDVLEINEISSKDLVFTLNMNVLTSPNVKFGIDNLNDFEITLPSILKVKGVDSESAAKGWTVANGVLKHVGPYAITDGKVCTVIAEKVVFGESGVPVNGTLNLSPEMTKISMKGEINFKTYQSFVMTENDYADIQLSVSHPGNQAAISLDKMKGRFAPVVDIPNQKLDISESLPDFLQDDKVRIAASNPTLDFMTDMTLVPVGVNLSANLVSTKEGTDGFEKKVLLPNVAIDNNQWNAVYYYQSGSPYDPEGVKEPSQKVKVENLNSLVEVLPDYITVDFTDNKISTQNKLYEIEMDKNYSADVSYNVYVPFEFSNGLTIVYKDSTNSIKDDLEDYAAHGLKVKAVAENVIPLELLATVKAVDVNNNEIPGIHFTTAQVAPSEDGVAPKVSELEIEGDLDDPMLLQKIDRLFFNIEASSAETATNHKLLSTQYLVLKDIKIKLKGQVIADFN